MSFIASVHLWSVESEGGRNNNLQDNLTCSRSSAVGAFIQKLSNNVAQSGPPAVTLLHSLSRIHPRNRLSSAEAKLKTVLVQELAV